MHDVLCANQRFSHLTRFHGVFAPNSKHRAAVTSEGKEKQPSLPATTEPIACIEDRQVINKILAHINRKEEYLVSVMAGTGIRAPPTDYNVLMN